MKNITIVGVLMIAVIAFSSCKKWIDPEINKDPNKPTDVSLYLLLPSAETGLGYAAGGDLKYAACIWIQQMAGGANQPLAYDRYVFTQSDVDNVWKWGMYAGPMKDMKDIIDKAEAEGSPAYAGIGKIMMAYSLGCITDLWNDAPYTEAWKGVDNLAPAFDTQAQLYAAVNTLLDQAISDLDPSKDNVHYPGGEDFIYGGDPTLWIQAAYSLKARHALHLSKRDGAAAYTAALTALADGFTGNSDDFELYFGNSINENNPMYQFFNQRYGDIVAGAYFVDTMLAHNDPRLPLFVDTTGGPIGSHAGEGEPASLWPDWDYGGNPYYNAPNSPVPFMSYVELKFIEAEALLMTSDPAGAALAHNDAVAASLNKFGVPDAAYIAAYGSETAGTITLEKIISQKYFALAYQLEVYNDWRRTGFPVLTPAANGVISEIPRRYPYPTSEVQYNPNCPSATISNRVWWDQ